MKKYSLLPETSRFKCLERITQMYHKVTPDPYGVISQNTELTLYYSENTPRCEQHVSPGGKCVSYLSYMSHTVLAYDLLGGPVEYVFNLQLLYIDRWTERQVISKQYSRFNFMANSFFFILPHDKKKKCKVLKFLSWLL